MIARITLTRPELDELYSNVPFDYNFEALLAWNSPFSAPIVPPDITALTDEALFDNAKALAQDIINRVEASCPPDTPGFDDYLEAHYLAIEQRHSKNLNKLYAKKAFTLILYNTIKRQAGRYTDLYSGSHIYTPDDLTPAERFFHQVQTHFGIDSDFWIIEQDIYQLVTSITAAQVEIVLTRCLKKTQIELEKHHHEAITALANRNQQNLQSNSITFSLNPTIQLGTTQGPITLTHRFEFKLRYEGLKLLKMAQAAALRIFRLGIGGVFYSPELGNADLYHDSALSIPAELLIPDLPDNIQELAATQGSLDSPLRIHTELDAYILSRHLKTANAGNQIPVRALIYDEASNSYVSVPSRDFPIRLTFPIHAATDFSTTSPGIPVVPSPYEGVNLDTPFGASTPFPAIEPQIPKDCIYCFPAESGLPPLYIVFNSPYPGATTVGTYSGRAYNPDKAGGPVERLDWRDATFTQAGVDLVKLHISRFDPSDANVVMIDRLEKILHGKIEPTDIDKRFITHELRELERFRALGIADRILPIDDGEAWNNTHAATLEDYQLSSEAELLYTPKALEAELKQLQRDYQ